ncbi:MAG: Uma2 family endonuclease [Flavobacteriales bacterium]|nr:Uma2 family endonuclease [Flavobacteriales bacterium]
MSRITNISQLDFNKRYTYADYLTWAFDERVELIKGWIYKMSPAPKRKHQRISFKLTLKLGNHLDSCGCQVYEAPFDVRLKKNKGTDSEIDTVVQPDISVFCDLSKLDDRGGIGAPDLIVEITSDSTMKKDYNEKFNTYEENGVREYWIVNPDSNSMELFKLENNKYTSVGIYNIIDGANEVTSVVFPDLTVNLIDVFKD